MKVNSNFPIFVILSIFIASNALLYQYLNNGYFVDKTPTVEETEVENVIFKLIEDHERVLAERNEEILRQAEQLRNQKANITDSAELKAIEEKLKQLELEALAVQDRVKNSENERRVAERQAASDQMQLTELLEQNSRLGAEYDQMSEEFENYVTTIEETLIDNSFSERDINIIRTAFRQERGLTYLNDLVGNIQQNKTLINQSYTKKLRDYSDSYNRGLQSIAEELGSRNFQTVVGSDGLIEADGSFSRLSDELDNYKNEMNLNLLDNVRRKEEELTEKLNLTAETLNEQFNRELEEKLLALSIEDQLKLKEAITELERLHEARLEAERILAEEDKLLSLETLEEQLRSELVAVGEVVEIDIISPDILQDTSWVHIPSFWSSDSRELKFKGKAVETIAWSRNSIEDNQTITFDGEFLDAEECLMVLYGDGKFKSWRDGVILSIKSTGENSALLTISEGGIDSSANILLSESVSLSSGISGYYQIQVNNGLLSISIDGSKILESFELTQELSGRWGVGNRSNNKEEFRLNNIKLFKIL